MYKTIFKLCLSEEISRKKNKKEIEPMPESLKNVSFDQMDQVPVMELQVLLTMEEPLINYSSYTWLDSEAGQDATLFKNKINRFSELLRCLGCLLAL